MFPKRRPVHIFVLRKDNVTNQTHRNFAGRIYFPVLITPESLSALFTFFWPALNLRPKEKLYARRMTNKRELSFKYMLLRNEAYCDLFSESCLNVFINGLKTPAPTINPYTCIPHIGFAPVHRPSWSPRKAIPIGIHLISSQPPFPYDGDGKIAIPIRVYMRIGSPTADKMVYTAFQTYLQEILDRPDP